LSLKLTISICKKKAVFIESSLFKQVAHGHSLGTISYLTKTKDMNIQVKRVLNISTCCSTNLHPSCIRHVLFIFIFVIVISNFSFQGCWLPEFFSSCFCPCLDCILFKLLAGPPLVKGTSLRHVLPCPTLLSPSI